MKIVCVGDCGIDHYLPSGDRFFGGITANFARHAQLQFAEDDSVSLVSAVGDDEGAKLVVSSLDDSGIDCHIQGLRGATPVQYIEIEENGERNFVRYEEGVLRDFRLLAENRELIALSDLLVAPVYLQITGLFNDLMSITTCGLTSIDFADFLQHPDFGLLENNIDRIDIGFFGLCADDREIIAALRAIATRHDKLFVVTLGASGSVAFHGSQQFECAACPVETVLDTTGAGDAYAAAFLSHYCHGQRVENSMAAGAQLAANIIQVKGTAFAAKDSLPPCI